MIKQNLAQKEPRRLTYAEALKQVPIRLETLFKRSPEIIRTYMEHLALSHGKFIRARAMLLCAMDDNEHVPDEAVEGACVIELIHLASLVHDDVMDDADLRRGVETLQKKYGKRTAVICGDYVLSLALKLLSEIPNRERYISLDVPDYISRLCLGELLQHIHNGDLKITSELYLKIIAGKTAALFEAAFHMGAVMGGEKPKAVTSYKQIGFMTGMIFQLMDDIANFEETEHTEHKPVQSDYGQGVITLPLIHALSQDAELRQKAQAGNVSSREINSSVYRTGGIQKAEAVTEKYYLKILKRIGTMEITGSKKAALENLVSLAARKG